jgi:hypothetical protein
VARRNVPTTKEAVKAAYNFLAAERILGEAAKGLRAKGDTIDFQDPKSPGATEPTGGRLAEAEVGIGVPAAVTASALLGHDSLPKGPLLTGLTPIHGDWRPALLHGLLYGGLVATLDGAITLNPRHGRRIRELVKRQDAVANYWLGNHWAGPNWNRRPTLPELAEASVPTLLDVAVDANSWRRHAQEELAEAVEAAGYIDTGLEPATDGMHRLAMDIALESLSRPGAERSLTA